MKEANGNISVFHLKPRQANLCLRAFRHDKFNCACPAIQRSVLVAERLALPTSDHGVAGSNPAGGEILPEPKRRFIAQSLSCSPFHRLEMTEILLKGRKTLTHPSIQPFRGARDLAFCLKVPLDSLLV